MLRRLLIKNFALIDDLDVSFSPHFNCLTGETGSGKTIILESLNLLFGGRADATFIRDTSSVCVVSGVFDISSFNRPFFDNKTSITISRTIDKNSNNTIKLDSTSISLTKLKEIASKLGTIFLQNGPLSHLALDSEAISGYLDKMNPLVSIPLLNEYNTCFYNYNQQVSHLKELKTKANLAKSNSSAIKEMIDELSSLNLVSNELDTITNRLNILTHAAKVQNILLEVKNSLDASEDNLIDRLYDASKMINSLKSVDDKYQILSEDIKNHYFELKSNLETLDSYLEELDFDEADYNDLSQRAYSLSRVEKKFGKSINELIDYLDNLKEQYALIQDYDNYIKEYTQKVSDSLGVLSKASKNLTTYRQSQATILNSLVTKEAIDLNMASTRLDFEFSNSEFSENGADNILLMVSFNQGEPLKPFEKIASGGERNRILMILEYLLCQINHAQILIFDEIDNGISGYTTHLLSKKLQEKAQDFQVIVITHSAILSAYANNHYKIEKIQKDNKTSTFIKLLDEDMRIREIAYMMSGSTISASALDQASELLKNKKET